MTVLELKEKRADIQRKMEAMLNKAQKEQRSLDESENKEYEGLKDEVRSLTDKVEALEQWLGEQKAPKKEGRKFSYVEAIKAVVEGRELEEPEAEVDKRGRKGMTVNGKGFFIPMEKRYTLQAGVQYLGKEDVAPDYLDLVTPLENELIAAQAGATFLTGLQGDIVVPFYTGSTAGWASEIGSADNGEGTFKQKTLAPKRITGYIDLSRQLLIQANDSIERYIQNSLVTAVRETLEGTMFGNGDSSDTKPAGLLYGTSPRESAITYGALVDAETSLLKNNFKNLAWVGAYDALGTLKQTQKVSGQAIMLYEDGLIDGRPVYASNNVASKSLILGDFSELTIGQWGGIEVLVDPYTQSLNGTVRLVVNSYWNYFVRRGYNKAGNEIVPMSKIVLQGGGSSSSSASS